jgi:hypothetical protein
MLLEQTLTKVYIKVLEDKRYGPFQLEQMGDLLPRTGDIMHGPDDIFFGRVLGLSWFWDSGLSSPPTSVVILTSIGQIRSKSETEPDFFEDFDD